MGRIKITGYVDTEDLDAEHVDLEHESGLSEEGQNDLLYGEKNRPLKLTDLEEIEAELQSE